VNVARFIATRIEPAFDGNASLSFAIAAANSSTLQSATALASRLATGIALITPNASPFSSYTILSKLVNNPVCLMSQSLIVK
jgi:hypothetical protein